MAIPLIPITMGLVVFGVTYGLTRNTKNDNRVTQDTGPVRAGESDDRQFDQGGSEEIADHDNGDDLPRQPQQEYMTDETRCEKPSHRRNDDMGVRLCGQSDSAGPAVHCTTGVETDQQERDKTGDVAHPVTGSPSLETDTNDENE